MNPAQIDRSQSWCDELARYQQRAEQTPQMMVEGKLTRMVGMTLEAIGCLAPVGAVCDIVAPNGDIAKAEVVGFAGERLFLMPTEEIHGLVPDSRVIPTGEIYNVPVSDDILGRVIDGAGRPLDGKGPISSEESVSLNGKLINPMQRKPIHEPLDVGVRAINALLTVGRGQRMGLFAGSGVGKSVLLGMMTRFTTADVIVVGMIGERGREVKEFIERTLGEEGMRRAVVVAAPADTTPLMRIHGAMLATSIAEYFRDKGHNVLLLMDSLTRYAQAQREIALAIGEPPATKGYPPSVFARLPQLVERAGNGDHGGGSITAFYTVLAEGDDQNDPIADAARAILDGHIVLTRDLADSGHYPAIDIEKSISRAMTEIVAENQQTDARRFKKFYSTYEKSRDLISVGAYIPGHDVRLDAAVQIHPQLVEFLQQGMNEPVDLGRSCATLDGIVNADQRQLQAEQTVQDIQETRL
ncbi:flagellar protein export ATPase FliI [Sulfuriflexus mobilis]|uniref:flagellar protein export ATPase FliI n=1 Tax=Sulfuriflexus mobilis TaxID=1811807 RepID=UPI000F82B9FB|nr:flagellar protein export ATPase FliI [Sulfuriflexus mobilis]